MCECTAVFTWEWGSEVAWRGLVLAVILRDVVVLLGYGLVMLLLHIGLAPLGVESWSSVLGYLLGGGEASALAASKADPD